MSKFNKSELINSISELGRQLINPDYSLSEIMDSERQYNAWFTRESVFKAVMATGEMLQEQNIAKWL